jgi:hypothetical protein
MRADVWEGDDRAWEITGFFDDARGERCETRPFADNRRLPPFGYVSNPSDANSYVGQALDPATQFAEIKREQPGRDGAVREAVRLRAATDFSSASGGTVRRRGSGVLPASGGQAPQDLDAREVQVPAPPVVLVGVGLVHPTLQLNWRGHSRREVDLGEEVVSHGSFR